MVATNGHRLAKMDMPINAATAPASDLIVPPKALEQIRRLFPAEEELKSREAITIWFRSPFTAVFTRLIEGRIRIMSQVIPKDNDRVAVADKVALTSALKRMSVIASDQTHRIRLSFNSGMLKFACRHQISARLKMTSHSVHRRPARYRIQRQLSARDTALYPD